LSKSFLSLSYQLIKNNIMRNVNELTQAELEELRSRFYHQALDDGSLEEVMDKEIESEEEIPMDLVKDHYCDYLFVDEDFFCNIEN